jgi:hypothetical protein
LSRATLGLLAALAAGALLTLGGCPASHDPFPDKSCKADTDCFEGETCVMLVCTQQNDLAVPDMALPIVDFATPGDGT